MIGFSISKDSLEDLDLEYIKIPQIINSKGILFTLKIIIKEVYI